MNRLIKSTALGLSVLMGCSLCACGVTDSSLGQKTEINPGLWVEKEVALEPDPSDILALTTTTDGQLLCATVQSNGEASQKVDVLSSSDGYTWDTTPVYSVEVPGTCIEASLTESGVLVLTRTEDEEQIWYGAKETECSQVQPADSEVTDINNIQFVNSDSFLMAGRDTNNQSVAAIFSLRDGRMVTKVGAGTEWGGFAQHGDELAFISETGKLSTLKANGEIQEGNVEGLENIIAAYCDSQGNYYYADSEGIYRVAAGGTLKEEITPSSGFAFSVQGKVITNLVYFQDSFFCVVKDTSDDSAQLYSYTFDPDATPSEQIELTVWSLSDSPTVRRVLSEYQQQHNDIAIQYTVAGSDDLATEDVLKALNTELLAGSGPDLIVFDGIDVTPYIENGVLADLNESLQEFSILDSIKNAFSVDGKTYIAAARYAIPSIWGTADDMDQITDLSSFIEFVKSCPPRDDYNLSDNAYYTALPEEDKYAASFMTPQEILQFLMSTSASELITDNTLNILGLLRMLDANLNTTGTPNDGNQLENKLSALNEELDDLVSQRASRSITMDDFLSRSTEINNEIINVESLLQSSIQEQRPKARLDMHSIEAALSDDASFPDGKIEPGFLDRYANRIVKSNNRYIWMLQLMNVQQIMPIQSERQPIAMVTYKSGVPYDIEQEQIGKQDKESAGLDCATICRPQDFFLNMGRTTRKRKLVEWLESCQENQVSVLDEKIPLLSFAVDFVTAYEYQKARGIKIHPGLWKDMRVDIFLVKKEN